VDVCPAAGVVCTAPLARDVVCPVVGEAGLLVAGLADDVEGLADDVEVLAAGAAGLAAGLAAGAAAFDLSAPSPAGAGANARAMAIKPKVKLRVLALFMIFHPSNMHCVESSSKHSN